MQNSKLRIGFVSHRPVPFVVCSILRDTADDEAGNFPSFSCPLVFLPSLFLNAVEQWAYENGVEWHFIEPGKPIENAYVESFNGKFRDEMSERKLVYHPGRCQAENRTLEAGSQSSASAQRPRLPDTERIPHRSRRAGVVSPHDASPSFGYAVQQDPGTHIMIGPKSGGRSRADAPFLWRACSVRNISGVKSVFNYLSARRCSNEFREVL